MGANSGIEWTHHTFNHVRGCTKVSEGCKNCYAETLSGRNPKTLGIWGPRGTRAIAAEAYWREPLRWNEAAKAEGVRKRVFCASLADVFEGQDTMPAEAWEKVQEARQRLFALAYETKWLDWLFLTKRPQNIPSILASLTHPSYPNTDWWTLQQRQPRPNWWFGTSVENQDAAETRIPALLSVPAVVRFLSCEPLLGAVDLRHIQTDLVEIDALTGDHGVTRPLQGHSDKRIHWVIAGGESGPNARPMHPDWVRSLRDQCVAAGVAYHFKQWGEWLSADQIQYLPVWMQQNANHYSVKRSKLDEDKLANRIGKKDAGRLLDGREWNQFPLVPVPSVAAIDPLSQSLAVQG